MRLPNFEAVAGRVQFESHGRFCPTLVIGSGGSGVNTVRRVKRILKQRYGQIGLVKFLFVDCDQRAYSRDPMLADVDPHEQASIVANHANNLYQEVRQGLRPEISTWLPEGVTVDLLRHADGAGGIRPVGRFALYAQFAHVRERIQEACRQVMQIETLVKTTLDHHGRIELEMAEPRVYIVNSICGGTGSAIFMDLALLTRYTFRESNVEPTIIGLFYLPSVFQNEQAITQSIRETILANAYAGLMELEFFCDPDIESKRWEVPYPGIGTITVDSPVFDECYLIEGVNAEGHQLSSKEEVFEMTARSLYIDIGSPVGAHVRSAKRNTSSAVRHHPCLETDKVRLMNSLATTQVKVPIEELSRYCALRTAQEIINRLIGSNPSSDMIQEFDTFLRAHSLEERDGQDQILDQLLSDGSGALLYFSPGRSRQELQQEALASGYRNQHQQAQYYAGWLDKELERFEAQQLARARALVEENKHRLLNDALHAICRKMLELAKHNGLLTCKAFLNELKEYCQTVATKLTEEARAHDNHLRTMEENIVQEKRALNHNNNGRTIVGAILGAFRKSENERTMDNLLDLTDQYANAKLRQVARNAAIELLSSKQSLNGTKALQTQLDEWLQLVERAIHVLENARTLIHEELKRSATSQPVSSTYVLEQPLLPPSQFDTYYSRANLNFDQLKQTLWDGLARQSRDVLAPLIALSGMNGEPEKVIDLLVSISATELGRFLEQNLTVISVLQEQAEVDTTAAQIAQNQVRLMLQVCKPFWTTAKPRGRNEYELFMAVTIPCRYDDPNLNQVKQMIEDTVREAGFTPELVQTDYPFALEICVRAYGARTYYLSSTREMKLRYDERFDRPNTKPLLHTDKRYLSADMPKLHPEPRERAELLFAWGVAYGYIAKRGESYYMGVEWHTVNGQRIPVPKYESDWSAKITFPVDLAGQHTPQLVPDSQDLIAQGRAQAMEKFVINANQIAKIGRVLEEYGHLWHSQRMVDELEEYLNRLDEFTQTANSQAVREQYRRERALLEAYIQRLQGRA